MALGSPVAADVGILVLDPTGKGAFNAQGSGTSTVNGTPIIVDSNNPEAAIAGGGGIVEVDGSYLVDEETEAWPVVETPRSGGFVSAMRMIAGTRF